MKLHVQEKTIFDDVDYATITQLKGNCSKAERKSILKDFLSSLDGNDPFSDVGDTLCNFSYQNMDKIEAENNEIREHKVDVELGEDEGSDGEDSDFKDEDYDFFL